MKQFLSERAKTIQPSLTLAVSAKAKKMKEEGLDVLNFSAGEPDFDTPEEIKTAAMQAIRSGFTKYTAAGGIPELKAAIVDKYEREQHLAYKPSQVLVSNGGKHALHNIFQATLDPGDEVIIPSPYWLSYPDMVRLSGGVPVFLETTFEGQYKITPDTLAEKITKQTKLLILNSPSNPTGAVYTADELTALAKVIESEEFLIISDDVYERYVFDGRPFANILMAAPHLADRIIVINSGSKTYSMPGWRIGYALGPESVIRSATSIQGQATSCAGSISQKALVSALQCSREVTETFRRSFEKRRDLLFEGLSCIRGIKAFKPAGAFYLFADVSGLFGKMQDTAGSTNFCNYLLEQWHMACIPGIAFGTDRCIRLSFVSDVDTIEEGIKRFSKI